MELRSSRLLRLCAIVSIVGPAGAWAQTVPPSVSSVTFSPSTVSSGGTTQLIITFANSSSSAATLSQAFSDPLPAGLQLSSAAAGGSCSAGSVIATAGGHSVGYASGAQIPSGGCAISVSVKAPSVAGTTYYTDTVAAGALQTSLGASPSAATATLTVQNNPLTTVPAHLTAPQSSVANALSNVCTALQSAESLTVAQQHLLSTCNAVISTYGNGGNSTSLPGMLNAISGRQLTAQQETAVQFAGTQFTNIATRLEQLRSGAEGGSLAGLDLGMPTAAGIPELADMLEDLLGIKGLGLPALLPGGASGDEEGEGGFGSRLGLFINGNLRQGTQDTTLDETGFDFKSSGVTAGADYRLTDDAVLGVAYGHTNGWTDFIDSDGDIHSVSNTASLYGTYYRGALYVDLIGTYGHNTYAESRTSSFSIDSSGTQPLGCIAGECTFTTAGSTGGSQIAAASNVGYTLHEGGLQFGPEVSLDYTRVHVNGFTEDDPSQSGLALAYGSEVGDSLLAKAGGTASYAIDTPIGVILPEVRAHYVHEFKDDQRTYAVHFADDPDIDTPGGAVSNFVIYTDQPGRNYLDWAAGITAQLPFGFSGFVEYGSVEAQNYIHTNQLSAGVRFQHPFD